MSDTTEGIERALVAWEGAARAATPGPWEAENMSDGFAPLVVSDGTTAVAETFDKPHLSDAAHIAANDPAAVLRMVAGIRAVVALADEATGLDMTVEGDRGVGRDSDVDPWLGDQILQALAAMFAPAAEEGESA